MVAPSLTVRRSGSSHLPRRYPSLVPAVQQDLPSSRLAEHSNVRRIADGLARSFDLLRALTETDLRVRSGRGPWRFVRWLLDPVALVAVYLPLVTFLLNRPG